MFRMLNMYGQRWQIKLFHNFHKADFTYHICSFGGVGTSFFMEFVNRYYKTNDIEDYSGYKHINFPPKHSNGVKKIIYIYGDPVDATISLFRRNYARAQAHINGNPFWFRNITLNEYVQKGRDRLFLTKHFSNWTNSSYRNYPVYLVRYEQLWENLSEIFDFLEIPVEDISKFPERRQRESSKIRLDLNLRASLQAIYSDLYKKLEDHKSLEII